MSRTCHPLVLCLLAAASIASAAEAPSDTLSLMTRVRTLSAPALGGRATGSPGARAAADSIVAWFETVGLAPVGDGWFHDYPLRADPTNPARGRNVLGRLPGAGALADRLMLIGAHYDHLGWKLSSDGADTLGYHPGAEDNASGIAALIDLAARLSADVHPDRRTVIFAAFSGEEIGLLGSRALAADPPWPADALDLMINIDSVGRLRAHRLYVGGLGSSPPLRRMVEDANRAHGLALELSESGWDASDHVSFNTAGVPVLFFFTGPHPQYHSVDDTWDLVRYAGLARVIDYVADVAEAARIRIDRFPYTAQAPSPAPASGRGGSRAWLGTIPDFVDGVDGVKLAGVMPGGPAEETGLRAGDVLVRLGEHAIGGLPDLTRALQSYGAGSTVEAEVRRDGTRMTFTVTLRSRPR